MSEAEELCKPLLGVWKCDNKRTEKFDELLAAIGVNYLIRKVAIRGSPKLTFTMENGMLTVKNEGGISSNTSSFPLDGTVIEVVQFGGNKSQSHFTIQDGKPAIVSIPNDPKAKKVVVTREVVDGELIQYIILSDGEVTAKRVFVKQP